MVPQIPRMANGGSLPLSRAQGTSGQNCLPPRAHQAFSSRMENTLTIGNFTVSEVAGFHGLRSIRARIFRDLRGGFFEAWTQELIHALAGGPPAYLQENCSISVRGVVRGLHLQVEPRAQAKLVRVASGRIFDVVVDVRENSPSLGKWFGLELDAESGQQLWIPQGYAHGFLALSEVAEVVYLATAPYSPVRERIIRWDDPELGIRWPLGSTSPILSPKDAEAGGFAAFLKAMRP